MRRVIPFLFTMLSISYSPHHDLKNWLRIARRYPENFQLNKDYPFNRRIPLRDEFVPKIVASLANVTRQRFEKRAKLLEGKWMKIEDATVWLITKSLSIPFSILDARAALTTAYLMPYDVHDRWFMIPATKPLKVQLRTIIHELFHLYHIRRSPNTPRNELEETVERFLQQHWGKP